MKRIVLSMAFHKEMTLMPRSMIAKSSKGKVPRKTMTVRAITILLLVFVVLLPVLLFPPHEPLSPTGPYTVARARSTYVDKTRAEPFSVREEDRKVNVAFWYPQNADGNQTYPLIVFSHGGLGTENSNESLYLELASHGYVVVSIGHPYHALWTEDEDGHITFVSMDYVQELQREDAKTDKQQSFRYYQKWLEVRTSDINFVIDNILKSAASGADGVYALIDVERMAVMGHSLGGSAALAIPRQRNDIAAVIALESPFLYDIVGVENNEFVWLNEAYPVPVLNIYSDASWSHLSEWTQYARNDELLSRPQTKAINLHLSGAGHFSLTDLPLASPLFVRLLEGGEGTRNSTEYLKDLNIACLEFLDHYLKHQGE